MSSADLLIDPSLRQSYADVLTDDVVNALRALAPLDAQRKQLMRARIDRRRQRFDHRQPIAFLDPDSVIAGTDIKVRDAREGRFVGAEIPADLQRQWIQGTGPAA